MNIDNNPVHKVIKSQPIHGKFGHKKLMYLENLEKIAVLDIEKWFLEHKYNPKYKYCRDRLRNEFTDLYVDN